MMPTVGPFRVDIKERDRRIVYQCDGAERYKEGTSEKLVKLRFQEFVMKSMGYKVVSVPHWHMERITLKKARVEYMRMSRHRAINDLRERAQQQISTSDVTLFDAEKAALEWVNVGERFFKPEKLNRPWTWTRHKLVNTTSLPTRVTL
jgi:hypothetical protein